MKIVRKINFDMKKILYTFSESYKEIDIKNESL